MRARIQTITRNALAVYANLIYVNINIEIKIQTNLNITVFLMIYVLDIFHENIYYIYELNCKSLSKRISLKFN